MDFGFLILSPESHKVGTLQNDAPVWLGPSTKPIARSLGLLSLNGLSLGVELRLDLQALLLHLTALNQTKGSNQTG